MKIEVVSVLQAAEPDHLEIQHPQPPANEPDRDDKEYLEWRRELL